jgi:Protein of unknown function (DUF1552)
MRLRKGSGIGIHRRALLRGAGVTMALPWLPSLASMTSTARAALPPGAIGPLTTDGHPKRLAVLFMGNGINGHHWWAKGAGAQMELGKSVQPLAPFKEKLNFITGLYNKPSTGVGIHPGQTGNILSGVPLQRGAVLKGGVSMDQLLAQNIGQDTMQPSMVLGCEQPNTGYHETNFSMAYSSHISWSTPHSPVPMEVYPSLAFDSLFENKGSRRTQSILDRVKAEASGLQRQLATSDRPKLEEYLSSVREVEKRVERMRGAKAQADARARHKGQAAPSMKRPDNGLPEDFREHIRLMMDVVAMAFQTDKTRFASVLMCRDLSGLFYPFLDVRDAHHPASHRDLTDDYERVSRFYCSQVAYLSGKLAAMPEGEGTVLDHSCVMFLSNMWSGYKHDNSKLPVVTVGGLGGTLATGRVLDYRDKGDDNRRICSLYLSLMDRFGVKLDRFGDSDRRLADA